MGFITEIFNHFGELLTNVLPTSPFRDFINAFAEIPYLSWLNWFVPFRAMIKIFTAWLAAVSTFYLYSISMRWLKMIGH